MILEQTFCVPYRYPVWFGRGLLNPEARIVEQVLGSLPRCAVCYDQALAQADASLAGRLEARFRPVLPPIPVPPGERAKEGFELQRSLLSAFADARLDRHNAVVAVGGGAAIDAIGLAAALVHRGLRLIRVPTTSLAMADAAVGVKNGINWHGAKNFIGTFAPPAAVLNDYAFLEHLPVERRKDALAEAFKVAIIKDRAFFERLEADAPRLAAGDLDALEPVIEQTARLHLRHIATGGDPFEMGSARPLDFGHWAAHKLETLTNHRLTHGQAVAIGVALDSRYAAEIGLLPRDQVQAIIHALTKAGLPVWDSYLLHPNLPDGIEEFRAHLGGTLAITLPAPLGAKTEVHTIDRAALDRAIQRLKPPLSRD
ncbi:MAG: 3-dehydroquinate synthase [Kiritimatiellia bacterium]|nr:3-dehydroquinate synthase [Kiritimatiellia bacterium]